MCFKKIFLWSLFFSFLFFFLVLCLHRKKNTKKCKKNAFFANLLYIINFSTLFLVFILFWILFNLFILINSIFYIINTMLYHVISLFSFLNFSLWNLLSMVTIHTFWSKHYGYFHTHRSKIQCKFQFKQHHICYLTNLLNDRKIIVPLYIHV